MLIHRIIDRFIGPMNGRINDPINDPRMMQWSDAPMIRSMLKSSIIDLPIHRLFAVD
jgi:hypothetical protein